MFRISPKIVVLAGALALAGCGGGGGGGDDDEEPEPPPTPGVEEGFGSTFLTAYKAAVTAEPIDVSPSTNLPPVSFTTDPKNF